MKSLAVPVVVTLRDPINVLTLLVVLLAALAGFVLRVVADSGLANRDPSEPGDAKRPNLRKFVSDGTVRSSFGAGFVSSVVAAVGVYLGDETFGAGGIWTTTS